jgi:peptide/nickel transport system permease protein
MTSFIFKRFLQGILAVFLLTVLIFVLARATGDPVQLYLPLDSTEAQEASLRISLGLDGSLLDQFVAFMGNLAQGDFGDSLKFGIPATDLFWARLPNTLRLMIPAFFISHILAVLMGVVAAARRGSWVSTGLGGFAALGLAVPGFWIAIMFMLVFSVNLGWLPAARMGSPEHYVLPLLVLVIGGTAGTMRLARSSMLEQLDSEYIRLARAKGVSERAVIWRHALMNSSTSVVAASGAGFALLLTGSILIENVFAWPGTGRLLQEAIAGRDFTVVQTLIILQGVALVVINLIADILQARLDPRIRISSRS